MEAVLNGKDVIVTAPTDDGKTVTFQGLPFIVKNGIILIIEPTKALISNQVE
jgi:superfamily II DNA helicase RecQ